MSGSKIFISHSVKDKEIADALVDLLVTGANIKNDAIFCSSLEGLGIPKGKNFIQHIKEELQEPEVVIMILTLNYFESNFCICELGASWILSHSIYPILVPPLDYSDIKDVLTGVQVGKVNIKSDLDDLKDIIVRSLKVRNLSTARWDMKRNQFTEKLESILQKISQPQKVSYKEYKDLEEKYEDALNELGKFQKEIDKLNELVAALKKCKDKEEVQHIVKESLEEKEIFDNLTNQVKVNLRKLPNVVKEALYYEISSKKFVPDRWDDSKWRDVEKEQENGYLYIDDSVVGLNTDDLAVKKALESLNKLQYFIYNEASLEFYEVYQNDYEYKPSLTNKRFWQDIFDLRFL